MTMVGEEVALATQGQQQPWTNASLKRVLNFGGQAEEPASDEARLSEERHKLLLATATDAPQTRHASENRGRDQALPLDPLFGMLQEMHPDMAAGPEERDE